MAEIIQELSTQCAATKPCVWRDNQAASSSAVLESHFPVGIGLHTSSGAPNGRDGSTE